MKKLLLLLFIYGASLFALKAFAQCGTAVQNLIEDFNTLPNPNDRSVLPACWGVVGGSAQMDSNGIMLALLGSSNPGTLITPDVQNGAGVITFKARKTTSFTVFLSVGYYSGGSFKEAVKYTLGGNFQTYTYDYATYHSTISTQTNLAFKITSGANSGVQRLLLDDIQYKSFCQPAAVPTALAKDFTAKLDETGNVIVNAASLDNGSTDDCGESITNFSLDKSLFTCDDLGVNAVILTATDSEGQTATAAANVIVEPDFVFNSNQLALDENGESIIELDFLTRSKTDCEAVTYVLDITKLTCADAGNHLLTVTASYNGLTKTYSATKNLRDYINPIAKAKNISVSIDKTTGVAALTPAMIDDGSSDNCGIASMSLSKTSFDCGNQGINEVTLTVTDDAGRSSTAKANVTVESFVEEFSVTSSTTGICFDESSTGSGVTVETSGSTVGTQYYLRNDADSTVVDGPIDGTGNGLSFDAGTISKNTTFHVYGEVPFSGKALDLTHTGRKAHLSVNTPGNFDYSTGYTISAWIKLGSSGNSTFYNGIFYAGGTTGSDIEVYENSSGVITVLHNRGNSATQSAYSIQGNPITNNTYVHFAATYNGSASRIFVNGVDVGAATLIAPTKSASSELTFGYLNSNTFPAAQNFPGIVDDIRVYDRALTSEEILSNYDKCISGTEDNLLLYYDLETLNGSIYTDLVNSTPAQIKEGAFSTDDGAISCSFTCNRIMSEKITIGDAEKPTILTNNLTLDLNKVGRAIITPQDIDNGSSDNCTSNENLVLVLSQTVFTCDNIGENEVTLTVTDESGNSSAATATVTINDNIPIVTISANTSSFCDVETAADGLIITSNTSTKGLRYFLQSSNVNGVIDGTKLGTGEPLSWNTGAVTENTTFNLTATLAADRALAFDGVDDHVVTDFVLPDTRTITIEAMIYPEKTNLATYLSTHSGSGSMVPGEIIIDNQIGGSINGRALRVAVGRVGGGGIYSVSVGNALTLNQWNHVAVTMNANNMVMYVNGARIRNVSTGVNGIVANDFPLVIGEDRDPSIGSQRFFQGKIDDVRIWNTTRTAAEISSFKAVCLKGNEEGLIANFNFEEGNGLVTKDYIGNNTANLTNMDAETSWVEGMVTCEFTCRKIMESVVDVVIGDNVVPTVVTKNISVILNSNGTATISPEDINDGSSDNCTSSEALTLSLDVTAFDNSDLGENTVTLSVTDANNNVGTATATVTVLDKELQTTTFTGVATKTFGDADFTIEVSLNSSLSATFTVLSGGLSITESAVGNTGGGSATFNITGAGTATIEVTNDGNETYAPLKETITIEVAKADQLLTLEDISDKSVVVKPFDVVATIDTNLALDYSVTGPASNSGATITLDGTIGTVEVMVSQAGTDNYNSISKSVNFEVVEQQSQTIEFTEIPELTYGVANQTLAATASSNLDVSYTLVSGPATLNGNTLSITGVGDVIVSANQVGNDDFLAASVQQTIVVSKAGLTITADDQTITYGDAIPTLTYQYAGFVNGEDAGALSSEAAINTTANAASDAGTYPIELTGGEAVNYNITLTNATLTINKKNQVITIESIENKEPTDAAFDVVATVDSGLELTYEVSGPVTISGTTITLDGTEGTATLTISQLGDVNHIEITESISFEVAVVLSLDNALTTGIKIFPNPVSNVIYITTDESIEGNVSLYNIRGVEMISYEIQPANSNKIDVAALPRGLYILIVRDKTSAMIRRQKVFLSE